jgi:integrase
MRQANFRTTWVKAIDKAGVARKTVNPANGRIEWWPQFHKIRHAFASRLHAAGVPEVVVQEILGHERGGEVTWLYTHAANDVAGQVLAALMAARPPLAAVDSVAESTSRPQHHHAGPGSTGSERAAKTA